MIIGKGLLSMKEADRVYVIGQVTERRLGQREAAARLGLSVRQVKRLVARYRERGPSGLVSGHRGKRSNNALTESVRREALVLVRERYEDFGPTFACEKLVEAHGLQLSAETLRQWMISDGLWCAQARREVRTHPSRPRRSCFGDLVQIDGSPHDWFEGRAPRSTLIVFIDDATSRLIACRFAAAETTEAYMETMRVHLAAYGRPVAYYSDRYGVFRVNYKTAKLSLLQEGQGGRVDAVLQGLENTGHCVDSRAQRTSEGTRRAGESDAAGPAGEGDAAARDQ